MKQKHSLKRVVIVIFGCFTLVLAGAVGTYLLMQVLVQNNPDVAVPAPRPAVFSFHTNAAPGWYKSPLDTTSEEGRTSILLFDRDPSLPVSDSSLQSCHATAFVSAGSVDVEAKQKSMTAAGNANRQTTLRDTKTLVLFTVDNEREYKLYEYEVIVPEGADPIKAGNAFGYIQLDSSYIELQVVCDTFDQLESALPALQAIRLDEAAI